MQLSVATTVAPVTPAPSYNNLSLAKVAINGSATEWNLLGRNTVGDAAGYASVEDAINAAKLLSAGTAPTLAILDAGTKFYPVELKFRYDNSFFNLDFSRHPRVYGINQNVRAFVEGGTVALVPKGVDTIRFR